MKKFFYDGIYWLLIGGVLIAVGFFVLGIIIVTGIATMIESVIDLFKKNKVTT